MLLTLDTSIVISAWKRDDQSDLESIDALLACGGYGRVSFQLTEAYERDFSRYACESGRLKQLMWVGSSPILKDRAGGAFRLGVSLMGKNDLLVSEAEKELDKALTDLLGLADPPLDKCYSDIDHLISHWLSGAEAFITSDNRTILAHSFKLKALGILTLCPRAALDFITSAGFQRPTMTW